MDWSNERYARLYTRDTTGWLMLPWQARALLPLLLRKLDRAGVMDLAPEYPPAEVVALMVAMPAEVVAVGLPALVKVGTFEIHGDALVMPNYLPAQEAAMTDAQRQREARARRRDQALRPVTECDSVRDAAVTNRDAGVTAGHMESQPVTPSLPEPSVPTLPDPVRQDESAYLLGKPPKSNDNRQTCRICKGWVEAGAGWLDGYNAETNKYDVRHRPEQCVKAKTPADYRKEFGIE